MAFLWNQITTITTGLEIKYKYLLKYLKKIRKSIYSIFNAINNIADDNEKEKNGEKCRR